MKNTKKNFLILILSLLIIFSTLYLSKNISYSININTNSKFENVDIKNISKEDILNIKIVERTFYSKKTVEKNDISIFAEMINSLDLNNIVSPVLEEDKYLFKIYLECKDSKFIIDVYGDDIIAIYPWDGLAPKLFLSISNLPLSIKTESICNYIYKN